VIDYPPDDVLIARGKYSTLNSERRELIKGMQECIRSLSNTAHLILRDPEDTARAEGLTLDCYETLDVAKAKLDRLAVLIPLMEELRPLAWETTKTKEDF
jgi:hypothetical protein